MKATLTCPALLTVAILSFADPVQKPRIFVTESASPLASGDASVGDAKGSVAFSGGTSPQNIEVMRAFSQHCPGVVVTTDRGKAEYVVRLDHEAVNPTTPFVHGNKVAVFNKNQDLVYTNSTRALSSAVKGACIAITGMPLPAKSK